MARLMRDIDRWKKEKQEEKRAAEQKRVDERYNFEKNLYIRKKRDTYIILEKLGRARVMACVDLSILAGTLYRVRDIETEQEHNDFSSFNHSGILLSDLCEKRTLFRELSDTLLSNAAAYLGLHGCGLLYEQASVDSAKRILTEVANSDYTANWLADATLVTEEFGGLNNGSNRPLVRSSPMSFSENRKITKTLNEISRAAHEIKVVGRITKQYGNIVGGYNKRILLLNSDIQTMLLDYSGLMEEGRVSFHSLSVMEQTMIRVAWQMLQSSFSVLMTPLIDGSALSVRSAKDTLESTKKEYDIVCRADDALKREKSQCASVLAETREFYTKLYEKYHTHRGAIRSEMILFADDKISAWNGLGKEYFTAISKFREIPVSEEMGGNLPFCNLTETLETARRTMSVAENYAERRASLSERELLHFAVNSAFACEEADDILYHWLWEDNSNARIDNVGAEDFREIEGVLQTITGKESLAQAQEISDQIHSLCQGIQNENGRLQILADSLKKYRKEIKRLIHRFAPISNQVIKITSSYEAMSPPYELTTQERKTVSISWEYAQLLNRALTDSFFDRDSSTIILNEGVPSIIRGEAKAIQKRSFKFQGEDAYAVDSLWKDPADQVKIIACGIVVVLVIVGILCTISAGPIGLLYLLAAVIAFPVFFVNRTLSQNQLFLWRLIRVSVGILFAVIVTLGLVLQ